MPSKGKPTVTQKQKNAAATRAVNPDAYRSSDIRQRYIDTAKIIELNGDWATATAIRIFGPELMGSIAFALDNLAQFKNSFRLISKPTRTQFKGRHMVETYQLVTITTRQYANWYFAEGDITIVDEYLDSESIESFTYDPLKEIGIPGYFGEQRVAITDEYQADSTQNQRYEGQVAGTLIRRKDIKGNWYQGRDRTTDTYYDYSVSDFYGFGSDTIYNKIVTEYDVITVGATAIPAEWIYFERANRPEDTSDYYVAKYTAEHYLSDFVSRCLANRRFFQGFYQIGELRDLPKLITSTRSILQYLQKLIHKPEAALSIFDKRLGDAYLTYLFGYKSIQDALRDLLKTPERLAKHFNYVLSKNNRVSVGKFQKTFEEQPPNSSTDPIPLSFSPFGGDVVEYQEDLAYSYDVRCSVNQTLAFPPAMVPKFSDSNYRKFLGLNPTVEDIYNLIPFTWLMDWFTGLGSYIKMIETCTDDRLLINYGFMTVVLRPKYVCSQVVEFSDRTTTFHFDGSVTDKKHNVRRVLFNNEYSYEFTSRMDIADLNGEKPGIASLLARVTDDQFKILGALITKFT